MGTDWSDSKDFTSNAIILHISRVTIKLAWYVLLLIDTIVTMLANTYGVLTMF